MDTTETQKSYSPFKLEDKFYFGGFFNLAMNNIQEVFIELGMRLGEKQYEAKDYMQFLSESFQDKMSLVDYERNVRMISDYFPMAQYLDHTDKSREERIRYFRETFKKLIETVKSLRHYYTHYAHSPIDIDKDVFDFLDQLLFHTALHLREKYTRTDKTKEILSKKQNEVLEKLIGMYMDNQPKYANGGSSAREQIINAIYDDAFKDYIIVSKKKHKFNRHSASKYSDESFPTKDGNLDVAISQRGLVFLLSLFLSKKEIEECKSGIHGFKGKVADDNPTHEKNSIQFMATHRIFSILHYKGLKHKIRTSAIAGDERSTDGSGYQKETFVMQMLDELSKVPDVVYRNLSEEQQNGFIEDWNEYYKNDDYTSYEDALVCHPVIRKRYEDKFNYFAVRFLDEYADFPTLRFQVYLGDYVYHSMDKELNQLFTHREIKEKVTVFARLSEVEAKKAEFLRHRSEEGSEPNDQGYWNEFPNPSYDFPKEQISVNDVDYVRTHDLKRERQPLAGKIGIKLSYGDTDEIKIMRYLDMAVSEQHREVLEASGRLSQRKSTKSTKKAIIEKIIPPSQKSKGGPIVYYGQPTAYLSMNDIHSLLYLFLSQKKSGEEIEKDIRKKICSRINSVLGEEPTVIERSLNKKKLVKHLTIEKESLGKLYEEQKQRDRECNDPKHKRKYPLYASEKGKVAVWLADDIKRFMPQSFKAEWKGYHHRELQKLLAYYEDNRSNIQTLLKNSNLNDARLGIEQCFNQKTLRDFYLVYLKNRTELVSNLIKSIEHAEGKALKKQAEKCFRFMKKKNYYTDEPKYPLAHPIFLARGSFDSKPTMIRKTPYEGNEALFADWFRYYKDYAAYQRFYDEKEYPLIEPEDDEKGKKERKRQTEIKKQQKNDVFLLWMAKYLLGKIFGEDMVGEINLNDLFQPRKERLENEENAAATQERNENYIWNKAVDLRLPIIDADHNTREIEIKNVKLKDIGNFRKHQEDVRVKTFLTYEEGKEWQAYPVKETKEEEMPRYIIEREIEAYEKIRRTELLKEVQSLEEDIYLCVADDQKKELQDNNGNENFKMYVLNGLLKHIRGKNPDDFKAFNQNVTPGVDSIANLAAEGTEEEQQTFILVYIRNKFAHNQLPPKEFWAYCNAKYPDVPQGNSYSAYYLNLFIHIREELLAKRRTSVG